MKKLMVVACILLVHAVYAEALMRGLSTEELARDSDLVIDGDVDNVVSYWSNDGKTIYSKATVIIAETVRGRAVQQVVDVEYEGGEVGEVGLKVSDMEPLRKGERVVLFLRGPVVRNNSIIHSIVGKGQGKYSVGVDGIARKGGFSLANGHELIDNNIPLATLIEKIRSIR